MTALAWVGWRLAGRPARLSPRVGWTAVVLVAVLFGVGHLPAVAATTPLTTPLVVRTVALNAAAGVVYGWLYWRKSLEAAMFAHAASHVVLVAAALVA
jgi:membrane protease YdiL (CAAX protease family)